MWTRHGLDLSPIRISRDDAGNEDEACLLFFNVSEGISLFMSLFENSVLFNLQHVHVKII